jgi:hypothetical protein
LIGLSFDDEAEQNTIDDQIEADAELIIKADDTIVKIKMDIKRTKEIKNAYVNCSERQDNSQWRLVQSQIWLNCQSLN